jgi:hypothetical protein
MLGAARSTKFIADRYRRAVCVSGLKRDSASGSIDRQMDRIASVRLARSIHLSNGDESDSEHDLSSSRVSIRRHFELIGRVVTRIVIESSLSKLSLRTKAHRVQLDSELDSG